MNKVEAAVHDFVGDYPWIKDPLVYLYQGLLSSIPTKSHAPYGMPRVIPGFFFGFHDTSPWSSDNKYLLCHKFSQRNKFSPGRKSRQIGESPLEFGMFACHDFASFVAIGSTTAWNWQQGSSLQWLGPEEGLFTVNNLENGQPTAQIWSVWGQLNRSLPVHLANCSPDGRYGVSYCFRRLSRGMPGYGYSNIRQEAETDELSVFDLSAGEKLAGLRLEDVIAIEPSETMRGAYHFFSHALFSPDSDRFLFCHRWRQRNGVLNTRLYSMGVNGEDLFLYPGSDYSHLAWRNGKETLAYCRGDNRNWGYYLHTDGVGDARRVGQHFFTSDGHPQFNHDGDTFVTDSYPDRYRQQRLFTYTLSSQRGEELLRLKIPHRYRREQRCDFHPRWSPNGKAICFDSAHTGVRSLCVLEL